MDQENHLEKKSDQKIEVKLPHVNKKPLARKQFFVQTLFSHSALNHATKSLAFSLHFLFRRDQNHYSNLTSKSV